MITIADQALQPNMAQRIGAVEPDLVDRCPNHIRDGCTDGQHEFDWIGDWQGLLVAGLLVSAGPALAAGSDDGFAAFWTQFKAGWKLTGFSEND